MLDYDDIAPQSAAVLGEDHAAIGHGEDILTEIGVAAADAVPIFARMNPHAVFFSESGSNVPAVVRFARGLIGVRAFAVRVADWKVEPVGGRDIRVKKIVKRIL